jgi:hypothetical protein
MNSSCKPRPLGPCLALRFLAVLGLAVAAPTERVRADNNPGLPVFTVITPAVKLEWEGTSGSIYQVERSLDLLHWEPIGTQHYGIDSPLVEFMVAAAGQEYFRLRTWNKPTIPPAPWQLTGNRLALNGSTGVRAFCFLTADQGSVWLPGAQAAQSFSYTLGRTDERGIQVLLTYPGGLQESASLTFCSSHAGVFSSTEDSGLGPFPGAWGAFGDIPSCPPSPPLAPPMLMAKSVVFHDGGLPELLTFSALNAGTLKKNGASSPISCQYSATDLTHAWLRIDISPGNFDHYTLTFTTDRAGTFQRTQSRYGMSADTDAGYFSLAQADD